MHACVGAHTSCPGCWTTGLVHTEGVRDTLLVPRPSTDVGKRQRTALWATVMSDSLCSAGLWQGLVVTGEGEAPLVQEHFTGPTDGLSPRYLFILWPNTTTGFHLQLHFKTRNSRSAGVAAPALARRAARGTASGPAPGRPCSTAHTAGTQSRSRSRSRSRGPQ